MVTAPASTGSTPMSKKAVISQPQTNMGMRSSDMPGARMLRMVARILMAPIMDDSPIRGTEKMAKATLVPFCRDRGGYMVQPEEGRPLGRKAVENSSRKANGSIQNEKLLSRGSAMSGAPIMSGIIQLASPTKEGMTAPKIMTRPCMVVSWLKTSGLTSCSPGMNSSARMIIANEPPTRNMVSENTR